MYITSTTSSRVYLLLYNEYIYIYTTCVNIYIYIYISTAVCIHQRN